MSNKEHTRMMLSYLMEHEGDDYLVKRELFSKRFNVNAETARSMILELTSLQVFCEQFGVII